MEQHQNMKAVSILSITAWHEALSLFCKDLLKLF
jgi:hypothetical protein